MVLNPIMKHFQQSNRTKIKMTNQTKRISLHLSKLPLRQKKGETELNSDVLKPTASGSPLSRLNPITNQHENPQNVDTPQDYIHNELSKSNHVTCLDRRSS